ncbi:hypothetical protein GCM10008939_33900 [Deinococcus aquiradiocola]|uniref:Uncharacterized protein n=1 Tax=Deinococcus aquiradiocola TaxID=393059 RepID=A0A917PQ74_9DEIO|nr:hypothetical protein GCM10008939_33900 [Deinococcus aquiradiocola]
MGQPGEEFLIFWPWIQKEWAGIITDMPEVKGVGGGVTPSDFTIKEEGDPKVALISLI